MHFTPIVKTKKLINSYGNQMNIISLVLTFTIIITSLGQGKHTGPE